MNNGLSCYLYYTTSSPCILYMYSHLTGLTNYKSSLNIPCPIFTVCVCCECVHLFFCQCVLCSAQTDKSQSPLLFCAYSLAAAGKKERERVNERVFYL